MTANSINATAWFFGCAASLLVGTLALSGCAGAGMMSGGGAPRTAVERAMQECVGTVVVGAVGGAILGTALGGSRNTAAGAIIGGEAGTVACAALIAMANEEDKARIAQLEKASVAEGRGRVDTYSKNGVERRVETRVYEWRANGPGPVAAASPPKAPAAPKSKASKSSTSAPAETASTGEKLCRYVETKVEVSGQGSATADKQLYCRTAQGDWEPAVA